jgi:hypothetical protein
MSLDLKDLRAKITVEADCAIEAVSRVRGVDRSEIVREVMHRWALQQIETCRVMHSLMRSEGAIGASAGQSSAGRGKPGLDWEGT